MRDFNVGVELEPGVRVLELALDRDATRRGAALGGSIAFTACQVTAMRPISARRVPAMRRPVKARRARRTR